VSIENTTLTNGTFTMKSGARIFNNTALSSRGGGVYVASTDTSSGIGQGGTFTMEMGSQIYDNQAANGGGVYMRQGTFTTEMGSQIYGNKATASASYPYAAIDYDPAFSTLRNGYGGGVCIGPLVSGLDTAYARAVVEGVISYNEVTRISDDLPKGGGVYNAGTFTLSRSGSIDHNKAKGKWSGGGVHNSGAFTMENGAIKGNETAGTNSGGGVRNAAGAFTMNGGSIIENKIAAIKEYAGGGVYIHAGAFTMNGGSITNNNAGQCNNSGGGVYIHTGAFEMYGGSITLNWAKDKSGGGVFVNSGTFTIKTGGCAINNNTAGTESGGGARIMALAAFKVEKDGSVMMGNMASTAGTSKGGVLNKGGTLTYTKPLIIGPNTPDDTD
jgi:hypothetical protein